MYSPMDLYTINNCYCANKLEFELRLLNKSVSMKSRPVDDQGAVSIRKTVLPGMAIPMLKIRRPNGRLIFNMEIAIRR